MAPIRLGAIFAAAVLAMSAPAAADTNASQADEWSAMVFGGRFFNNKWIEFFSNPGSLESVDSWIAGVAVSREIGRWPSGLQWEIEGQIARHFGDQDHWEVNAPLIARWTDFPWSDAVETGLAFGMGPSLALGDPKAERARSGDTSRFLLYWTIEGVVAAPDSPWSVVVRLHHRSNAYGVFGDAGGSNIVVLGLRRRF